MKILIIVIAVVIVGLLVAQLGFTPQKRGLGGPRQDMLVSNGRPALAVQPAQGMRLAASGKCTVQTPSSISLEGDALLWYALYKEGQASLVAALAEAQDSWVWCFGDGTRYKLFDERQREYKDQLLYESSYTIAAEKDPFALGEGVTLVRRSILLRHFRKVQVIVEYREPLPVREAGKIPALEDHAYLAAFAERARGAFAIALRDTGDTLPDTITALQTAPKSLSRRLLGAWLGEMRRKDND